VQHRDCRSGMKTGPSSSRPPGNDQAVLKPVETEYSGVPKRRKIGEGGAGAGRRGIRLSHLRTPSDSLRSRQNSHGICCSGLVNFRRVFRGEGGASKPGTEDRLRGVAWESADFHSGPRGRERCSGRTARTFVRHSSPPPTAPAFSGIRGPARAEKMWHWVLPSRDGLFPPPEKSEGQLQGNASPYRPPFTDFRGKKPVLL